MVSQKPDIFNYSDYKSFLNDVFLHCKSIDKKYSHRYISYQVGASSTGWFSNVISGRISLTGTYLIRLAKLFSLSPKELEYLELLVNYEQAASIDEKRVYVDKILSLKDTNPTIISKEHFSFYSEWYIPTIRELLFIYDFSNDYTELAKKCNPPITQSMAKKAIETLQKLQLITLNSKGYYKPNNTIIRKDSTFNTVHWANIMKTKAQLGYEAIERFPKDLRDISEVYVPLSEKGFEEIRDEIKALRKKILAVSERDKQRDCVYQCTFQLFPLTKKTGDK